jgi:tetratricopeptide (TPR) repeat protein
MRKVSSRAAMVALVAGLAMATAGCSQVDRFRAYMNMRNGHTAYASQDYRGAAEAYELALANRDVADADPRITPAYFYLANAYDNMYRPTRRGQAANDELLTKAVEFYKKSSEVETDPLIKRRALQYLYTAYGPEKLNDPSQSEPIVQQLIQMDPSDTTNYSALARLYEDNGDYENAEATLKKAVEVAPNSPDVYTSLAGFYERQDNFDAMIEALTTRASKDPDNPEAYYTLAVQYWNKAYRDFRLTDAQKMQHVVTGIQHVDKALSINKDYQDALVYKGLLLRVQANLSRNPAEQQRLLREADQLGQRAEALRKAATAAPTAAGQ